MRQEPKEPLKPCPFCGAEPYFDAYIDEDISTHNMVPYYNIYCGECDCASISMPDGYEGGDAEDIWNRRVEPKVSFEAMFRNNFGIDEIDEIIKLSKQFRKTEDEDENSETI